MSTEHSDQKAGTPSPARLGSESISGDKCEECARKGKCKHSSFVSGVRCDKCGWFEPNTGRQVRRESNGGNE